MLWQTTASDWRGVRSANGRAVLLHKRGLPLEPPGRLKSMTHLAPPLGAVHRLLDRLRQRVR